MKTEENQQTEKTGEPITLLHIPDSMFIDTTRQLNPQAKPRKAISALQMMLVFSIALFILGLLFVAQAQPDLYKMTYALFGGDPVHANVNMGMMYAAFFVLLGNLLLCIAGVLLRLHSKKHFGGSAVYFAIGGVLSIAIMLLTMQLW